MMAVAMVGRSRVAVGALIALAAVVVAYASVTRPTLSVVVVVAVAALAFAATHLGAAVAVLVGSFFFETYLSIGAGPATLAKGIGVVAMGAWLLHWTVARKPVTWPPMMWLLTALALWLLPSLAFSRDLSRGVVVASRYVMFFILFFVVVQAVVDRRANLDLLVDVTIAAAAIAALIGLVGFLSGALDRAHGPIEDPNDFGFALAAILPLAILRFGRSVGRSRVLAGLAVAVLGLGILATFSRSALVGLTAAAVWAVLTRRVPARVAIGGAAALVVAAIVALNLEPDLVGSALERKQAVAGTNVDTRLAYWEVALDQFRASPIVGVGPGNYETRFAEFRLEFGSDETPTTHNAYLNVLAELGLPGVLLFVVFLAMGWVQLRRRAGPDPQLRSALAAGFLVAVVGSFFLTQQFSAPLWLLAALGVGLNLDSGRRETIPR